MVSVQEMLIGNVKEETEDKIDIEHGFSIFSISTGVVDTGGAP